MLPLLWELLGVLLPLSLFYLVGLIFVCIKCALPPLGLFPLGLPRFRPLALLLLGVLLPFEGELFLLLSS